MPATISQIGNQIAIQGPYDSDFVRDLKDAIPYTARKWDGAKKVWLVDLDQEQAALAVANKYYEILDTRKLSAAQVEDAKIADEIVRIKANQELILKNEKWINDRVDLLSSSISRYSPRSVSRVRHGEAMDRALLMHALNNARIPVEKLTELQVRGLAAACRYVKGA